MDAISGDGETAVRDLAPTFGSYVELLTCVEIRTGSGPQAANRK